MLSQIEKRYVGSKMQEFNTGLEVRLAELQNYINSYEEEGMYLFTEVEGEIKNLIRQRMFGDMSAREDESFALRPFVQKAINKLYKEIIK